jgi:drug/metabolite transporter (DMT)-like permease
MNNAVLYLASVLIWGSTWFAIRLQLVGIAPAVSIVWRFLLAAAILLAYALLRRLPLRFPPRMHLWIGLQGLFLFCANYIFAYVAEVSLASGIVAVVFSLIPIGNALGMRLLLGQRVRPRVMLGAAVGVGGVALLFWPDLERFATGGGVPAGLVAALLGTASASVGNLLSTTNQKRGLPVLQVNCWAMFYGALCTAAYAALAGEHFTFMPTASYVLSLVYLALFGSVIAFGAYLTLLGRVGADRGAYVLVMAPVVALALSSLLEGLHWTPLMWVGVGMGIVGNVLVMRRA